MIEVNFFNMFNCQTQPPPPTPIFVYDLNRVRNQRETIKNAFAGHPFTQYYPVKTNPCIDILRCCLKNGLGLDACSIGDLDIADILKVPPHCVTFTGVGLNETDMRRLFKQNIIPNLSSPSELLRWGRLFPGSQIGIRVSTLPAHKKLPGEYSLKMGIFPQDWPRVRATVQEYNLKIVKLHRHESANSIDAQQLLSSFSDTFASVPSWTWQYVKTINFGGGWGLPYLRQGELDLKPLIRGIISIARHLNHSAAAETLQIEIEPGEYLVGYSGYLLTTVLDVRTLPAADNGEELQVVILDTPFPITSGFRAPELLYPVDFEPHLNAGTGHRVFSKIYGRSNTSMDTINKGVNTPRIAIGDRAIVKWVGAYVPVLMSYFNQQAIPAEMVLHNGNLLPSGTKPNFKSWYHRTYFRGGENE